VGAVRALLSFPDPVDEASARLVPAGVIAQCLAVLSAASLEAFLGMCLGCRLFARLVTLGLLPAHVCAACSDLSAHSDAAAA